MFLMSEFLQISVQNVYFNRFKEGGIFNENFYLPLYLSQGGQAFFYSKIDFKMGMNFLGTLCKAAGHNKI
jgi:hypothetical protein